MVTVVTGVRYGWCGRCYDKIQGFHTFFKEIIWGFHTYIVVDFADAPEALWEAVANISDRNYFFTQLQFIYGVKLYERESVIIFDEIQKSPETRQPLGEAVCRKLMRDFRLYMLVGGMPQAVNTYLDTINTDYSQYKMYVGDTGLFVTLAFWDKSITENPYQRPLPNLHQRSSP